MQASSHIVTGLIYSGIPGAVAIVGTAVVMIWRPNRFIQSGILHFSAGVAFAVIAVELLPDIMSKKHALTWTVGGFAAGLVIMLGIRWFERSSEERRSQGSQQAGWPVGLLGANGIDQAIDGVLLGIGITVGQHLGALLSFSMVVEDLTMAIAIVTMLQEARARRWQMVAVTTVLSLVLIGVTIVGVKLLSGLSPQIVDFLLSLSSAALLFMVTEQLIVEAHEKARGPLLATSYFAGFLLILALGITSA